MEASDDFDHYSPTSTPRESFSIEQDDRGDELDADQELGPQILGRCGLYRHFCCRNMSLLLLNVVSVFAAIHINRLLKTLVSPNDDSHGNVVVVSIVLFIIVVSITSRLAVQWRESVRVVWIIGLVGGHVMGFSTKQFYVALVRATVHEATVSVGVVWGSIPVLASFVMLGRLFLEKQVSCYDSKTRSLGRCFNISSGARRTSTTVMYAKRRHRAVMREAQDDAFAVVLGFGIFAAFFSTVKYAHPHVVQSVFEEQEACFAPSEKNHTSSDIPPTITTFTPFYVTPFFYVFLLMQFIFPVFSYLLRRRGHQRLVMYYTTPRDQRKALWKAQAGWLNMLGTALGFAEGFSLYEVTTRGLVSLREGVFAKYFTNGDIFGPMTKIVAIYTFVYTWLATQSNVKVTLRERREQGSRRDGTPIQRGWCAKYQFEMMTPSKEILSTVFLGLMFEAYFDCTQVVIIGYMNWGKAEAQAMFVSISVMSLLLVSWCIGRTFSDTQEKELEEEMDVERAHRQSVSEDTLHTHEELLLGSAV